MILNISNTVNLDVIWCLFNMKDRDLDNKKTQSLHQVFYSPFTIEQCKRYTHTMNCVSMARELVEMKYKSASHHFYRPVYTKPWSTFSTHSGTQS